jgi:hypothetical protein
MDAARQWTVSPRCEAIRPGFGHQPRFLPDPFVPQDLDRLANGIELNGPVVAMAHQIPDQAFQRERSVPGR